MLHSSLAIPSKEIVCMHDISVSICICTFRRPDLLRRLLLAILHQDFSAKNFEVIVVDNDPAQSAAVVLSEFQEIFAQRLTVLSLAEPNISLARNAAIHAASGAWIAMLDDDEYPQHDWLSHLVSTQQEHAADVVFAPVLPEYETGVPEWIRRGGFFERRRLPTGTRIDHKDARSGNVLVRQSFLERLPVENGPFDPAYGRTGGEDSMLFRQLGALGARMIWCDEAPVCELVPVSRATAKWLLQRSFRTGQLFMKTELACTSVARRHRQALFLSGRAIVQAIIALFLILIFCIFSPRRSFFWARVFASQLGKLNHFRGQVFHAYGAESA